MVESHYAAGGAAHTWSAKTDSGVYNFEAGPSLYSSMRSRGKSANPLAHVFQAIGEDLELIEYDNWNIFLPEGHWDSKVRSSLTALECGWVWNAFSLINIIELI